MLKSRTIYDYIIDRFGIMEAYSEEYRQNAREKLSDSVSVKSGKDEIISVSVEDKYPKRAADIANAFIEKLKDMTQIYAVTEASKTRLFFEEQVTRARDGLAKAEEAMQGFQERQAL
jgi:capsular polysaccharide biosynthesis protein